MAGLSAMGCGCHRGLFVAVVGCGFRHGYGCFCGGESMIVGVALCLARSKVAGSSAMGYGCRRGLLFPWWGRVSGVGVVVFVVVGL